MARKPGAGTAVLQLRWPIDLALTVMSHGWARLAPWSWEPQAGRLARTERIGGRLGTIAAEQRGPNAILLRWQGFAEDDAEAIRARVGRWLSADWEPTAALAALAAECGDGAALLARGGGRMLRCSCFYEDFVKTVLTINTSWAATCRMAAALVAEPGGGAFPGPQAVLDYGEARLRERARLGFRAPTLIAATGRMLADGAVTAEGDGLPTDLSHDYLIGLKGIGPYAAAHCRLLLHDFARIPIDSEVAAYLRRRHGCSAGEFVAGRAAWGEYLALGYKLMRLREKLEGEAPVAGAAEATAVPGRERVA